MEIILISSLLFLSDYSDSLTTNATLFTKEIIALFKEKKVTITISIDGEKKDHDKYRVFPNQEGSCDIVVKNINKLVESSVPFIIRATLPIELFDEYDRIYNHLSSLGAEEVIISRVSVYDGINNKKISLPENKMDNNRISEYFFEHTKNSDILNNFKKGKKVIIDSIITASHKRIYCGFMKGCTAVSCSGDLYPCHRYVGMNGFVFGHLEYGVDKLLMKQILKNLDLSTKKCEDCFARYICQRNCIREISLDGGTFSCFSDELCSNIKHEIEDCLILYYQYLNSYTMNKQENEAIQNKCN